MLLTTLMLASLAAPAGDGALTWHEGTFFSALGEAGERDAIVCVYFWSNQSDQCAKFYQETMAAEAVGGELANMVLFSANTADPKGYKLVEQYGVRALPTMLFVKPTGDVDDAVVGYIGAEGLASELQRIQRGEKTITAFRAEAEAAPDDLDVQYAFAVKLADCGNVRAHDEVIASMKAADPQGLNLTVARLHLNDIRGPILESCGLGADGDSGDGAMDDSDDTKTLLVSHADKLDFHDLEAFMKSSQHDEIRFDGYTWMASVLANAEKPAEARQANMKAFEFAGENQRWFGREIADKWFEVRDELDRNEKRFALKAALKGKQATLKHIEALLAEAENKSGCASAEGCPEGDGCGGCEGAKGQVVRDEAFAGYGVACAYFINGKRSKAIKELEHAIELAPDMDFLQERLALFKAN